LITVRKNSQAKNYEFSTKINVYFKADGKASNLAMVNKLVTIGDWSPNHIRERQFELINYFLKSLSLEEMENKTNGNE